MDSSNLPSMQQDTPDTTFKMQAPYRVGTYQLLCQVAAYCGVWQVNVVKDRKRKYQIVSFGRNRHLANSTSQKLRYQIAPHVKQPNVRMQVSKSISMNSVVRFPDRRFNPVLTSPQGLRHRKAIAKYP
jgi:hypothetical protein